MNGCDFLQTHSHNLLLCMMTILIVIVEIFEKYTLFTLYSHHIVYVCCFWGP